jgi:iron complex transport system substrate-binding protein
MGAILRNTNASVEGRKSGRSKAMAGALVLMVVLVAGCRDRGQGEPASGTDARAEDGVAVPLRYAKGFSILRKGDGTVIEVKQPWQGSSARYRYRLVPRDSAGRRAATTSAGGDFSFVLAVPLRRVVTMTTTNLPHFDRLGELGSLVGIGGGFYACHPEVRARLSGGSLRELGEEGAVDAEAALDLRPDAVFAFAVANYGNPGLKKLSDAGLPVVMTAAYLEESPLGRAEWIRFTAEFFGRGASADSAFAEVDSAYRALAALARSAENRPTVMANAPFGGQWWMPGGRSYVARLLEDAGADYLWKDDTTRGSLHLDLETVLAKSSGADFWLNPGRWTSLADGRRQDPRHALFAPFRNGTVWNNNAAPCGAGNDFFEKGATRPDWVLADLIAIFHPELMPGHKFRWYRRLEDR